MIQAGIDEAGYGPVLGPLVVALTAFDVDDAEAPVDLWGRLRRAVLRRPGRREGPRLPVADSKVLHQGGRLHVLERTALAFSSAAHGGAAPCTAGEWLSRHAATSLTVPWRDYAWYRDLDELALPLAARPDAVAAAAERLAETTAAAGARPVALTVAPLLEAEYSRRAERLDNKAAVLFDLNVRLIEAFVVDAPAGRAPVRVLCDRHGGRRQYADVLGEAFPMTAVRVLREDTRASAYRIGGGLAGARPLDVEYRPGGEREGMEVALASIFAKYTRELFVEQLNRHFVGRVGSLRRTAGYYVDGLRFVGELERNGALTRGERARLVRSR